VRYLLDVNALVALAVIQHEFHGRMAAWIRRMSSKGEGRLATCAITELGFIRVLAQVPQYGASVSLARDLLRRLKNEAGLDVTFLADTLDASRLPGWVRSAKQITDGHLVQLARAGGAVLATLDKRLPAAYRIP